MIRRCLAALDLDAAEYLALAGSAALVYGVAQVAPPAAWITGGALALGPFVLSLTRRPR